MERTSRMDTLTTNLVATLSKPSVGLTAGFGAGLTGLLSWLHVVGVVFGAIASVVGCVIACIHLGIYLRRLWLTRNVKSKFVCANAAECPLKKDLDPDDNTP